jgi:hypothetical protein
LQYIQKNQRALLQNIYHCYTTDVKKLCPHLSPNIDQPQPPVPVSGKKNSKIKNQNTKENYEAQNINQNRSTKVPPYFLQEKNDKKLLTQRLFVTLVYYTFAVEAATNRTNTSKQSTAAAPSLSSSQLLISYYDQLRTQLNQTDERIFYEIDKRELFR